MASMKTGSTMGKNPPPRAAGWCWLLWPWLFLGVTLRADAGAADATGAPAGDLTVLAVAHYSFGTAVTTDGDVLLTEFNRRQVRRWSNGGASPVAWRLTNTAGVYGITTGAGGDVFVGLDLGDRGNPGKVLRLCSDGREELVVSNLTRPRQLACDRAGNLLVAVEGGRVLRWNRATRAVTELLKTGAPLSGVAVGDDGSVYVSEYGAFEAAPEGGARPAAPGLVRVRRPDGTVSVLARGFWRARGIALHGRFLFLCSEADREDHGNAGRLVRIETSTGATEVLLDRLDYPQFPAVNAAGTVFFTLARENRLVAYEPLAPFRPAPGIAGSVTRAGTRGGRLEWGAVGTGIPFTLRVQALELTGRLQPDSGTNGIDGWIEIPAERFQLKTEDLFPRHDAEHPCPGLFELPAVVSTCASGELRVDVLPLRRHEGCRWPMQHVGTAEESPAAGFSERPEAFRLYLSWSPPAGGSRRP